MLVCKKSNTLDLPQFLEYKMMLFHHHFLVNAMSTLLLILMESLDWSSNNRIALGFLWTREKFILSVNISQLSYTSFFQICYCGKSFKLKVEFSEMAGMIKRIATWPLELTSVNKVMIYIFFVHQMLNLV